MRFGRRDHESYIGGYDPEHEMPNPDRDPRDRWMSDAYRHNARDTRFAYRWNPDRIEERGGWRGDEPRDRWYGGSYDREPRERIQGPERYGVYPRGRGFEGESWDRQRWGADRGWDRDRDYDRGWDFDRGWDRDRDYDRGRYASDRDRYASDRDRYASDRERYASDRERGMGRWERDFDRGRYGDDYGRYRDEFYDDDWRRRR